MADNNIMLRHPIRNAFFILLIIISALYSNNYNASWHMDDYHSIVMNPKLQINDLSPPSLFNTFFSGYYDENKLYRPLSCLTFAINWYMGKNNPYWFHVTNNIIHVLTAFFLFIFTLKLFQTPKLRDSHQGNAYFIALLASCFWAINPIQTQAVTYIVQRMASLAALFYIMSMLFYINARMAESKSNRSLFYTGCFFSFLMALASKENAATLPAALFIIEIIFFREHTKKTIRNINLLLIFSVLILILFFIVTIKSNSGFLLKHYEIRPFTPLQRLLTEPRILLIYLSLFFYPIPSRLSITHDIELSVSLFHPWTTLPALIFILILMLVAILNIKKKPLLGFAILFFFINHVIESSIIGLELIFEHRNYLPSFFLFLPVAFGFKSLIDLYYKKSRLIYFMLVSFMVVMLTGIGIGTYTRNIVWATEKSLWEDAMEKAPLSARPPKQLAWGHYEILKDYGKALEFYDKSLDLYWNTTKHKAYAYYDIAGIFFKKKKYKKAAEYYYKALEIDPYDEISYKQLVRTLIELKDWDEALRQVNHLLSSKPLNATYLNYKGIVLLNLKRYQTAIECFKISLKQNQSPRDPMIGIAKALELSGEYERAMWFYGLAHSIDPGNTDILLLLIDLSIETDNDIQSDEYIEKLLSLSSFDKLKKVLLQIDDDRFMGLISKERIIPISSKKIKEVSKEMKVSEIIADSK